VRPLGAMTVWRWESRRLAAQTRVKVVVGACAIAPWLLVAGLAVQSQEPKDTLFGIWVHASGWSIPLVMLGFVGTWLFPLLVAAIASGIFAGEDEAGIWPGLLTRSRSRGELFAGKVLAALTAVVVILTVLTVSSILAGIAETGDQPLIGLSGNELSGGHVAALVVASWASEIPPVFALAALALLISVLTRGSIAAVLLPVVLGLAFQVDTFIAGGDPLRHLLVTTPIESWHGFMADPVFLHPFWRGLAVSAIWFAVSLVAAAIAFARRDFAVA